MFFIFIKSPCIPFFLCFGQTTEGEWYFFLGIHLAGEILRPNERDCQKEKTDEVPKTSKAAEVEVVTSTTTRSTSIHSTTDAEENENVEIVHGKMKDVTCEFLKSNPSLVNYFGRLEGTITKTFEKHLSY